MSTTVRSAVALGMVAATLLGGCSGGGEGNASPTTPSSVSTTSTTTAPDVSVIPEVIDEAYLNAVLAALDEVDGEATRIIKATQRFPPEAAELLNAIYSDDELKNQANNWLESIAMSPELTGVKPNPGNRRTTVARIISASSSCVWLAVRRERTAINVDPGPARLEYVALQPLDPSNDPKGRNPTPWMITIDGYRRDGAEPDDPCLPQ